MRRYISYIIVAAVAAVIIFMTKFHIGMDKATTIGVVIILVLFVAIIELKGLDAKSMTLIATLSAIGGAVRVPFVGIPGLQPTTLIAAVSGYALGPVNGFTVGAMSAFISNFFLGQGPWTLWQMLGWGACGFFFGILKKGNTKVHNIAFVVLCGLWGYIYGGILDMWYVVAYVSPVNIKTVAASLVLSFPEDTLHAAGNIFFAAAFSKKFITVLDRCNRRFSVEYIESPKD